MKIVLIWTGSANYHLLALNQGSDRCAFFYVAGHLTIRSSSLDIIDFS